MSTEREKGRAFLSACMGRPLLKIDIDEKETGRLVRGAYKYIDLQDLRERGMVEEFTTAAERRRIERGADNGVLSPATR